jgi:putative ABC transport system permease protein
MLFDISPLDPVTYLAVTGLLVVTAIAASGVPAWRAARVDPASTLRSDQGP